MKKNLFTSWKTALLALGSALLFACGGGGGGSAGTGTLSLSLSDASSDDYKAVYVTVDEISVHPASGGGWVTVASPDQTYNLLELVNGVRSSLGVALLDPGRYTQMRLKLGASPASGTNILSQAHPYANYFINQSNQAVELKVPSGSTTGLKVVNGFDISAGGTTELLLDFSVEESIVKAGSSGKWLLKPTVKVLETAEYAIVSGTITNGTTGLAGIKVSLQKYDPAATDEKDEVSVEAASLTDANGNYALFVEPGSYALVASGAGYFPACLSVSPATGQTLSDKDLALTTQTGSGNVTGTVSIAGASSSDPPYATLSFRQDLTCIGALTPVPIEVKTLNVAAGGSYSVALPVSPPNDLYRGVASSSGKTTVAADLTVPASGSTSFSPSF